MDNFFFTAVSPEGSIVVSPLNVISSLDSNVTLQCAALGGPNNTFVWILDEVIVGTEENISLVNVDASTGGNYTCMVNNSAGSDQNFSTLYIQPYIQTPLEELSLTTSGSLVNISCVAAGFPSPTVYWVDTFGSIVSNTEDLIINPVMFHDQGVYLCVAMTMLDGVGFNATDLTTLIGKQFCIFLAGSIYVNFLHQLWPTLIDDWVMIR